ncbi:MAG: tRNA (adenosine(37)-N6)-threonylcarbamoyltransferase complex ATPase subunit type 1 TsaE [Cytophagales bacterium]|nr:tRNA (adenosine(37)-N6)-threonylcarbamoyltransferase complex ATPase subunit type 1 TsaE [Cytophagales bacterium]MCA6386774.1 tRNA (adenosine(37)-N6)-threonylcarbamoyltransferase complex ATPase subunit type 1 TsaE [Cytophagales bacterium]MCA6391641.1 tRNA (adenosine(37)-N6)-threonylcarbamoyltransferase complex ATPase subunit type 1 TsaE [Cytophagales bacterium]MCA6394030.1 tRNA (adenosine(37)-N6)-threonylcarbamoyltransferase complex ATPase subunit type 1 TsaE [Cytophagales bacterium]MCA639924
MDKVFGLQDLDAISKDIIRSAQGLSVWLINGEMGAGKTTLAKSICRELSVTEVVSSPTFSIINEYKTAEGKSIFHFDFYRLKSEVEAFDIGVNEYFESGSICLVEWAEKIPSLIPEHYFEITLQINDLTSRAINYGRH